MILFRGDHLTSYGELGSPQYTNTTRPDGSLWRRLIATIFIFALALRLMIACVYLNSYDTEWNIMWGIELGNGFFSAYAHLTSLDYPPLYLYPLYIVGRLMEFDQIAGYIPLRMLAIKFMPCLADSLTCIVLYRLGSRRTKLLGAVAAALWAVNPATIFNCAFWGQTDCVLILMAALLFLALAERRIVLSGVMFAAMFSTKLQGLYLAPVVGMEILAICFGSVNYKKFKLRNIRRDQIIGFLKFIAAVAGTLCIVYLPFMIGSAVEYGDKLEGFFAPLSVYRDGVDKYPYITMNADNVYMLFGLNGVNDGMEVLPGISVSLVGTFFLLVSVMSVAICYVFGKRRSHWLAAYMLMECIFMLTCRQHERYQILTLVMLIGAFIQIADKRIFTIFVMQSFIIFVNQARVLGAVRENSRWWLNYQISNQSMSDVMRESLNEVMDKGVWWINHGSEISFCNSMLNVCVFFVSIVLVLRFYFDCEYKILFAERAKEWIDFVRIRLESHK